MSHNTASLRPYIIVFAALMLLLVVTVEVSRLDLGRGNFLVAVLIASIKATLIGLYFMHLRDSTALSRLVALSGVLFLAILFTLAFSDYWTRNWLSPLKLGSEENSPSARTAIEAPVLDRAISAHDGDTTYPR